MTDETEEQQGEKRADNGNKAEGPLAGERLAAARREQQITVLEVAKELHLDEPKVRALEQNKFDVLGAPVFAKGHLRKYAMLVGVDNDDVLQDYYKLNRASGMPPVVGKVRKSVRETSPGPWIATIVILIIAAAAYWWFLVADESPPAGPDLRPATSEPQSPELGGTGVIDDGAPSENAGDIVDNSSAGIETVVVELPDQVAVQVAPPVSTTAIPEAGQVRLTMTFSGDCWTEISDASGRRLFFDLGREGRSVNVSGEAPLSVLFGNANNVRVRVNGTDYSISPADRRGETAKLTID
jgi:cytoskeleton protein RodZ